MTALTGWVVVLYAFLAVLSGVAPAWYYVAEPGRAHASVIEIESVMAFGASIRSLHHFSSHGCIVLLVAHMGAVLATKRERFDEPWRWASGVAGFATMVALAFTGRVLPWDQHAGVSLRVAGSILGSGVAQALVEVFGAEAGLARMLWLHLAGTLVLGWILVEHVEGIVGLKRWLKTATRYQFIVVAALAGTLAVVALVVRAPLGPAFQQAWGAAQITSEWYLRWVEFIAAQSGWLACASLVAVLALALSTPWWGAKWGEPRARVLWWALLSLIGVMSILPLR